MTTEMGHRVIVAAVGAYVLVVTSLAMIAVVVN
jgi:hypothetical protein